jgi:hypothetical protein
MALVACLDGTASRTAMLGMRQDLGVFILACDPCTVIAVAVFVLAFVVWQVYASRQRAVAERRYDLERWEYDRYDEPFRSTWTAHFQTMRLKFEFVCTDGPGSDKSCDYLLRRNQTGSWDIQMTYDSWREEVAQLQKSVDGKEVFHEEHAATLEKLRGGPTWGPLSDEMAPSLEAAYQLYINQRT